MSLTERQASLAFDVLRALNDEGFLLLEEILETTGADLEHFRNVVEKFRMEKDFGEWKWRKRWVPYPLTRADLVMAHDVLERLILLAQEDEEVEDFVRSDIGMHPEEVSRLARELLSARRQAPE